jgi:hypothetical protein
LSFDEFVKILLRQKEIQDVVVLPVVPKQVRMHKSKRNKKSEEHSSSSNTSSRFGSPIVRKSAMKLSSIYDFGNNRDDESSVNIHFPSSPKSPKFQYNDKNTNKYMPLIDEIEKDARKKMKHTSYKEGAINIIKAVSTEPDEPVVVTTSSSNEDIDGIDPNIIHVTTTEDDDNNGDDNSLQEEPDDTSESSSDDKSMKDDAILTTLKENSKLTPTMTKSLKHQPSAKNNSKVVSNNNINLYSMVLETSETTTSPASQSVQSTDLSSHMSSVMLKPLARVRVSHHHSHRV